MLPKLVKSTHRGDKLEQGISPVQRLLINNIFLRKAYYVS